MADIKFSEFQKATQSKDTDEIAILQDGVNKMIASPVLESKILDKVEERYVNKNKLGVNNGVATLGSDGLLSLNQRPPYNVQANFVPINLLSPPSELDGVFVPTESGTYENYGNVEIDLNEGTYIITKIGEQYEKSLLAVQSPKSVNTISELRSREGDFDGQIITLLGYYEAGDKEPLNYKYTTEQGVDDGGSVINTENGSWIAEFKNSVDSADFGLRDNDTLTQKLIDDLISLGLKINITSNCFLESLVIDSKHNLIIDFNNVKLGHKKNSKDTSISISLNILNSDNVELYNINYSGVLFNGKNPDTMDITVKYEDVYSKNSYFLYAENCNNLSIKNSYAEKATYIYRFENCNKLNINKVTSNNNYRGFTIIKCDNSTFVNIECNNSRFNLFEFQSGQNNLTATGQGFLLIESFNCNIYDSSSSYCSSDSFRIDQGSDNILLKNCQVYHAKRNGFALYGLEVYTGNSKNVVLQNCSVKYLNSSFWDGGNFKNKSTITNVHAYVTTQYNNVLTILDCEYIGHKDDGLLNGVINGAGDVVCSVTTTVGTSSFNISGLTVIGYANRAIVYIEQSNNNVIKNIKSTNTNTSAYADIYVRGNNNVVSNNIVGDSENSIRISGVNCIVADNIINVKKEGISVLGNGHVIKSNSFKITSDITDVICIRANASKSMYVYNTFIDLFDNVIKTYTYIASSAGVEGTIKKGNYTTSVNNTIGNDA